MQVQIELLRKLEQQELKTIPQIELGRIIIRKVQAVIIALQAADLHRHRDLILRVHPNLLDPQVFQEVALQEVQFQDHLDHRELVN